MELTEVCCWIFSEVHRSCLEVVQHQQRFSCEALDTQLKFPSLLLLHVLCQASVIQIPVQLGVLRAHTVLPYTTKNHICGGLQLPAIQIAVQGRYGINKSWAWGKNRCMDAFQMLLVLQLENQLFTASRIVELNRRIGELWPHRLIEWFVLEGTLEAIQFQPPAMDWDASCQPRLVVCHAGTAVFAETW